MAKSKTDTAAPSPEEQRTKLAELVLTVDDAGTWLQVVAFDATTLKRELIPITCFGPDRAKVLERVSILLGL